MSTPRAGKNQQSDITMRIAGRDRFEIGCFNRAGGPRSLRKTVTGLLSPAEAPDHSRRAKPRFVSTPQPQAAA